MQTQLESLLDEVWHEEDLERVQDRIDLAQGISVRSERHVCKLPDQNPNPTSDGNRIYTDWTCPGCKQEWRWHYLARSWRHVEKKQE